MFYRRLIIRLRVFFTLSLIFVIIASIGSVIYFHDKGLNSKSNLRVAKELERYGLYAKFDRLSFHIVNGLTANNVRFYRTKKRQIQVAELPAIVIHVDKTKLMRGNLKINTISITDATLAIPLIRGELDSPIINIAEVNGSIDLRGSQSWKSTAMYGYYEGIKVLIDFNIWRDSPKDILNRDEELKQKKINTYKKFLVQIKQWNWPKSSPPELKISVAGNLSEPAKLDLDFLFVADSLSYKEYVVNDVHLEGDWNQNLVTLDTCKFTHQAELCNIVADLDLIEKGGRFEIDSTIHLQDFAMKVFGKKILSDFRGAGKTNIRAKGNYCFPSPSNPKLDLSMVGSVHSSDFSFNSVAINKFDSEFSWNNGELYLDKVSLKLQQGQMHGRIIAKDRLIRYKMQSSLPAKVYFPFIQNDLLKKELSKLSFDSNSLIDVHANGTINQDDKSEWESHGSAVIENFDYNNVPISHITGNYKLNAQSAVFDALSATLDYSNYSLRKKFDGPKSATITAQSVEFSWPKKMVLIDSLRGTAWPAPVVRTFAPNIADHLEKYQFSYPPDVSCSGSASWNPNEPENMKLLVGFTSTAETTYNFLNKDIRLSNTKGQITILSDKVQVNKLSSRAFGGSISGYIHVTPSNRNYSGRFQWDRLQLKKICQAYEIEDIDSGSLTGSYSFRGNSSTVANLNGHGNLALSNGDLFAVPLFGPLSSLVDSVIKPLSKKQLLHEQARDFSCNFTTRNGVFYTKDLTSMTANTTFTGEGWIDINRKIIDLTIRMNFRGMMGLVELPMKVLELPFKALKVMLTGKDVKGLRQFHGTGKMDKPSWRFTPFQPSRDGKNDPIFKKPPKAEIVE